MLLAAACYRHFLLLPILLVAVPTSTFASSSSPESTFGELPSFDNEPLRKWLAEVNNNATVLQASWNEAEWSWATDITAAHEAASVAAALRYQSFSLSTAAEAQLWLKRTAAASLVDSTLLRQTRMWAATDLPTLSRDRQQLLERVKSMENLYSTARCPANNMTLGALSQLMGSSTNPNTLLQLWRCWHDTARPMRPLYSDFVTLANAGAAANGFADDGEFWRSFYDMPAADFGALVDSLWQEVKPLYVELHAFVRARLFEFYGPNVVGKSAPIPAHLLGNMWAQSWGNLYNVIPGMVPYPAAPSPPDASVFMKQKGFTSRQVIRTAEHFFRSLGMRELPPSFWKSSLFDEPPPPREAVCHASAWDFTNGASDDVRLKMCVEITEEDLVTAHHELGHLYYFLAYKEQPLPFRTGANDGFHEGIGDTLALSCNAAYLRQIGILPPAPSDPTLELQGRVNSLMKMALDKVAFLPFGFAVDAYRWSVFNGTVPPSSYTAGWWKLRQQYQGIAPAVPRSDPLDFDAGAKYHVAANVPYMRYFLAHVLQFQFQAVLCDASGYTGPLDSCSIYGSGTAGDMLRQMLRSGASLPWQDVLRAMTGSSSMSTRPILRYFKPLYDFLYRHNRLQPTAIGWGDDFYMSSPSQTTPGSPSSSDSSSSPAGSVVLSLVLVLIILWIAFKTRRQIRMRQRPIVEFEDMNEFGYSLSGRRFNQI